MLQVFKIVKSKPWFVFIQAYPLWIGCQSAIKVGGTQASLLLFLKACPNLIALSTLVEVVYKKLKAIIYVGHFFSAVLSKDEGLEHGFENHDFCMGQSK